MNRLCMLLAVVALAGCVAVAPATPAGPSKSQGKGPPAHAPAHGYRAKTPQGVEVAFDTQLGVYVVVALPGAYWLDDRYYRKTGKDWQRSERADGPWAVCAVADLPTGLRDLKVAPPESKPKKYKLSK